MDKQEAEKAKCEIFKLEKEIEKLQKPLTKYIEDCNLAYYKEKYEGKYFHTDKGNVVYCQKYEEPDYLTCIVMSHGSDNSRYGFTSAHTYFKYVETFRNVRLAKVNLRSECKEYGERVVKFILEEMEKLKKDLNYGMD
jgi:hypothetical protein